jgi:hypothetical protein
MLGIGMGTAYKVLIRKFDGKRQTGRSRINLTLSIPLCT